jgi:hypothetical protein
MFVVLLLGFTCSFFLLVVLLACCFACEFHIFKLVSFLILCHMTGGFSFPTLSLVCWLERSEAGLSGSQKKVKSGVVGTLLLSKKGVHC